MIQPVNPEMHELITARLQQISIEENVRILLAIESGSRAWGFHSPDSDYDVRFVYARPSDWHMKLGKKRDVIERPIDDELDISGWELSKALTLALRSNAVIGEWLQSPIKYISVPEAVTDLTNFCQRALGRKSVAWHYLSLLQRQQARMENADGTIRLKPYFYTLRPALALRWMRLNHAAMPPMSMSDLIAGSNLSDEELVAINVMTYLKKKAHENGAVPTSSALLDSIITNEVEFTREWLKSANKPIAEAKLWEEADKMNVFYSCAAGQ